MFDALNHCATATVIECPYCSKVLRSDNSKNRIKTHGRAVEATTNFSGPLASAGQKRPISTDISTFNRAEFGTGKSGTGPRNPKIKALFDEIINDNSTGQDMDVASHKSLFCYIFVRFVLYLYGVSL